MLPTKDDNGTGDKNVTQRDVQESKLCDNGDVDVTVRHEDIAKVHHIVVD